MKWRGKHTMYSCTCIMDPLVLEMAQKLRSQISGKCHYKAV